jgi:hypothetical protein
VGRQVGKSSAFHDPMIQTLFPNKNAVFQDDDNAPIHTAGTAQLRREEYEGELHYHP